MKPNVDLTANRTFSSMRVRPWSVLSHVRTHMHTRIFVSSDEELSREQHLVLTGDKKERSMKRLTNDELSRFYCDRCGAYLKRIPWNRSIGLCAACYKELNAELGHHDIAFKRIDQRMKPNERKNPFRI